MALFSTQACPICGAKMRGMDMVRINPNLDICPECATLVLNSVYPEIEASVRNSLTFDTAKAYMAYLDWSDQSFANATLGRNYSINNNRVAVDKNSGLLFVQTANSRMFAFKANELSGIEVTQNNETFRTGAGGAIAGAIVAGPAGAIVGGLLRRNTREFSAGSPIDRIVIRLGTTNIYRPHATIVIHNGPRISPLDPAYEKAKQDTANVASTLQCLMPGYEEPEPQNDNDAQPRRSADDTIEEILKYKRLLDAGIITQEEFTAKKKALLEI